MSRKPISAELWVLFLNDYNIHHDIGRAAARAGFNRVTVYRKMKSDFAFAAAVTLIRQTIPPKPAPLRPPSKKLTALLMKLQTITWEGYPARKNMKLKGTRNDTPTI